MTTKQEIRVLDLSELDAVAGGNAFWGAVLGYVVTKVLDGPTVEEVITGAICEDNPAADICELKKGASKGSRASISKGGSRRAF